LPIVARAVNINHKNNNGVANVWRVKKLFIVSTILFVTGFAFAGVSWYRLSVTKTQLADTKAQLADIRTQLASIKNQLADTEDQLGITEVELDKTETQLATAKVQLETAEIDLAIAMSQLEHAHDENEQMINQYGDLRRQINNKLALTREGRQEFLIPDNSSVSARVKEITGGYSENVNEIWKDYHRLYRWVVNNISYSYDSSTPHLPEDISGELTWYDDYWRTPEETLEGETGDCEDQAILLASMLKNYIENKHPVWVLEIRSTPPEHTAHLAAVFPVQGGNLTILDPAGNFYTGYRNGSLGSESNVVAVNRWISYWAREIPSPFIAAVFSEDFYEEFSSTEEFLEWLNDRNA